MNAYSLALFLHIVGAFGLFIALALEWNALGNLRAALTAEEARRSLAAFRTLRVLGPVSLVTILVAGLYMVVAVTGWQSWNAVGLGGMLVIFALGAGSNATRLPRLGRALGPRQGQLPPELRAQTGDPVLWLSMFTRAGIALGIVFLMTTKPDAAASLVALAIFAAAGVGLGWFTSRATGPEPRERTEGMRQAS